MTRGIPERIEPGLEGSCERIVTQELTLAHIDPSWPAVFSTPAMIGLMEYGQFARHSARLAAGIDHGWRAH